MNILIIKPSSLGDIIHALPFLKVLKNAFPDAHVEWIISKNNEGILAGNPLIDELIVFDKDSWQQNISLKNFSNAIHEINALRKTLRSKHFDMAVDLQGLLRSGLITFFARARLKIGFENAREGSRFFYNKKVGVELSIHAVDKNLEVAKAIQKAQNTEHRAQSTEKIEFPLYIDNEARERVKKLLGGIKEKEYIVIAPSARWQTKMWPAENFGLLISKLSAPCIITGSSADINIAEKITAASGGKGINLCGKTGLKELSALISGAKALVSNDSGPMHIGAALGIPIIALFGPTDPEKTGPYGWKGNRNLKVLRASVPCSPCFKKKCKEPLCMSKLSVEMVFEEIRKYF
ncbi:MAG: lipopolysaccharide heptosyltransferase II [Nitrospirae bacterium]|nr:lipopolysaccharide heptosyltransferase II [Nitrospirota bacterium]